MHLATMETCYEIVSTPLSDADLDQDFNPVGYSAILGDNTTPNLATQTVSTRLGQIGSCPGTEF
ncbi:hypothetical protein KDK_24720 [Dictyobacter kobayashii]|uniref:Uncharacterized protein n=1 Tax=Dictyobacter kobayashii TaxID=2014872 RepID=A0A402AHR8_9CHLR|nr:hypothetical protein KDK_24720 [Dictyobacter kobayashii]